MFVGEELEEGCILFGLHFSQSKNACLLNLFNIWRNFEPTLAIFKLLGKF